MAHKAKPTWVNKYNNYFCFLIREVFYSTNLAGEHGTLYKLCNLVHRINVVKTPKNDFNACEDFLILILTCHILSAAHEVLGMDDVNDSPSASEVSDPQNMWMHSTNDRKHILKSVCEKVVDCFILFQFNTAEGKLIKDRVQ